MKKITFLFFVLLVVCQYAQGQNAQKARGYAEVYGSYNQFSTLNQAFATTIEDKLIERGTGLGAGLRVIYGVFMFDGFWTNETFAIKDTSQPSEARLRNNVYGGTINLFLLPQLKNYITPYAGVGMTQTDWTLQHPITNAQGVIQKKDGSIQYKDIEKSSYQHIIWNVGLRAKISRVSLSAVYRQSLDNRKNPDFSQIAFSIGYNFWVFAK
jgi:Outer membrane protein beta-barrel domain